MNEEMTPEIVIDTAPAQESGAEAPAAGGPKVTVDDMKAAAQSLSDDFAEFARKVAAVVKAASATPEAEQLKGEIREGLSQLRGDIDRTLDNVRANAKTATTTSSDQGGAVMTQVRATVADVLAAVGTAVDRMASSVRPGEGTSAAPAAEAPAPEAGSESGGEGAA